MLAVAVNTVVFGAGSARHLNLLEHSLSRSVYANGSISFCNPCMRCEVGKIAIAKVDSGQCIAVLGLQVLQQRIDALADFIFRVRCRFCVDFQIGEYPTEFVLAPAALPVVIHHGVPEDAIEPRNDALSISNLTTFFDALDEGSLKQIFRDVCR